MDIKQVICQILLDYYEKLSFSILITTPKNTSIVKFGVKLLHTIHEP